MRVLVVEDEARVAQDLASSIAAAGFLPEVVDNGEAAWFQGATESYSAIVLDLGLPALDGMTVLKRWRKEGVMTPVIVLTARGSWSERVEGIDAGADDYLPKPFRMEELIARLRGIVRRSSGLAQPVITVGQVYLDTRSSTVSVGGVPVKLTPLEYRLLHYMLHNRGRVVSQSELSENLYAINSERESNAIEAVVGRLRRKLKADVIETRRGFGYFVQDDTA